MTKREALRQAQQAETLIRIGFTPAEADALRRISMTLSRWSEAECNGEIERDGNDGNGRPYRSSPNSGRHMLYRIPDRERGALRRWQAIMNARNSRTTGPALSHYYQGDPRGAAVYILRPGDVIDGHTADSCYSRGIAVY